MNTSHRPPALPAARRAVVATLVLLLATGLGGCREENQAADTSAAEQLLEVAERGDVGALDALLGRQASADVRDSCDWTLLMKAALNGHRDAVARLLAAGATVDAMDKGGYTALLLAASNNHVPVVELLLDHGAMIDAAERTEGYTAPAWAAQRGHQAAVTALLARGADRTLPDLKGQTPAALALAGGHSAVHGLLTAPAR